LGNPWRQELRDFSIVFVTVILIVVGTLGGYYMGSAANVAAPATHCSVMVGSPFIVGLPNGTRTTSVYQISPGSTATLCVTYTFGKSGTFAPSTSSLQCGPYRTSNRTIVWNCPGQISIRPSIQSFNHSSHQNSTVAYSLRAPSNDSGVYWFWLTCDDVIPIVVGRLPSSLVFPIIPGCIYEVDLQYSASVVGVSNMEVTTVPVG
jgi:hypothetical protein